MVRHIAADFLKDNRQYQQAQRYWSDLWDQLVAETGLREQWRAPWLGAPLRDGDPIFSALAPALRRGVHIIQHGPTSEGLELEAWVDRFGEEGKDEVIEQLVIACALSEEAAARARQLMRSWVVSGEFLTSREERRDDHRDGSGPEEGAKLKGKRGRHWPRSA
jgi:hypothetical protein